MDRSTLLTPLIATLFVISTGCAVGGPSGSERVSGSGKTDAASEGLGAIDPTLLPFPLVTDLRRTPELVSAAVGSGSSIGADNAVYRLAEMDCSGICEDDPASCEPCRAGGFMVPSGAAHPLPTGIVGYVALDASASAPFGEEMADPADPETARDEQMLFLIDQDTFQALSLEMPTPTGANEVVDVFRRIVVRSDNELELVSRNPADPDGPLLTRILEVPVAQYAVLVGPPADFSIPAPGADSSYRYELATTCIVPAAELEDYDPSAAPSDVDPTASCWTVQNRPVAVSPPAPWPSIGPIMNEGLSLFAYPPTSLRSVSPRISIVMPAAWSRPSTRR